MNITVLFPLLVAAMYVVTSVVHLCRQEYGWALVWTAYAMANVGMVLTQR